MSHNRFPSRQQAATLGKIQLVLLRGIPGAGKSTLGDYLAEKIPGLLHLSADDWRGYNEERLYNNDYNDTAHWWCLGQTAGTLRCGVSVVVSNCFHKLDRMLPYYCLYKELQERGYDIRFTVMWVQGGEGMNRSVHGTGVEYEHYIKNWEHYGSEEDFERILRNGRTS